VLQNIGQVESVKIITLLDDYAGYETPFYAQHGISLLMEVCSGGVCKRILLDVGQSGTPILHNMGLLDVNPNFIDTIFLSHCHYDHTQGLAEILGAIDKNIPVIGHPSIFRGNYIFDPFVRNIGITEENGSEAIKAAGGQLFLTGETFEIMQHQPHRLREVSGIGETKAEAIAEAFKEQWELRDIILFLSEYGITPNYAVKIYKKYGEKTIATLQENPYRLADI